jgi:uncharacterized membrane protein
MGDILKRLLSGAMSSSVSILISFGFLVILGTLGNTQAGVEVSASIGHLFWICAGSALILVGVYYTRKGESQKKALLQWLKDLWKTIKEDKFRTVLALVAISFLLSLFNKNLWPEIFKGLANFFQTILIIVVVVGIIYFVLQNFSKGGGSKKK